VTTPGGGALRIDYLVPDYETPSWGTALLYEHVRLLRELGHDARVLHQRAPFRLGWIESDVPVAHLDALDPSPGPPGENDGLVVPEVLAAEAAELPWPCRRAVFVQGSFLIVSGLGGAAGYPALGYERALAVLPHIAGIVERHFGLAADLVPPFIAPYFFAEAARAEEGEARERERTILLAAKPDYRRAGFPDYDIVAGRLRHELSHDERYLGWSLEELSGLDHRGVAERMKRSAFLVNLNSHEAFNTTVPEAMAAGCLPICYEAFGGRDFLVNGENAWVFPNHHAFPLLETVLAAMERFERGDDSLAWMRARARETAERFTEERTREALAAAFGTGAP
jgi:glycosyltransferase involved in cell wall biosynthesis